MALPNVGTLNFLVAYGELLAGISLILGFATMFAACMGALMNLNFMLAGSTSTNPILFTLQVLILAGGAYVGYIGVDFWFRPLYRRTVDGLFRRGAEKERFAPAGVESWRRIDRHGCPGTRNMHWTAGVGASNAVSGETSLHHAMRRFLVGLMGVCFFVPLSLVADNRKG